MFDYDTKEKEHQNTRQSDLYSGATPPRTNQIASCFGALSITYKSIKLKDSGDNGKSVCYEKNIITENKFET
jgi:hypothetical protein